jgi:hypothetical protein
MIITHKLLYLRSQIYIIILQIFSHHSSANESPSKETSYSLGGKPVKYFLPPPASLKVTIIILERTNLLSRYSKILNLSIRLFDKGL